MAGYQNKPGFSGNEVDTILKDYDYKATPHNISFAIDANWTGTEEDGLYPSSGEGILDNFPLGSALGDYKEVGIVLHFSFLGKPIYAQIQSVMEEENKIAYLIPFIGQDTTSDHNYHEYLLKVIRSTESATFGETTFRVTAVHPI